MNQTSLKNQLLQILENKKKERLKETEVPKIEETAKHVPELESVEEAPKPKPVRKRRRKILDDDDD